MQKQSLKSLLQDSEGKTIEITFRDPLETLTGSYKINSVKTGRGKGGSLLVSATNLTTGETLTQVTIDGKTQNFGTSVSEYVVNMTVDGTLHGPSCVEQDMDNLPKNSEMAVKLRDSMIHLLGKEGTKLLIESKLPSIDGEWLVQKAIRSPGVFGQLRFYLKSEDGTKACEFWTYRHSGVVSNVSILED